MAYKNTKMGAMRRVRNLRATDVCRKLKISTITYSQIETGRLVPSERLMKLLADFYGLPFGELVKDVDPEAIIAAIKRN